jgi:tetratricopeptide (TPR) repeat protein
LIVALLACSRAFGAQPPGVDQANSLPMLLAATTPDIQRSAQLVAEAARLLDAYSGRGDLLQQANQKLREALEINPDEPAAYVELARLRMKSSGLNVESLKDAEASLRRALAIDQAFGNAHVLLGYVLTHAGRFDEAEAAFAQAERTGATSPWLESNLAELKDKRGQRQVAAEIFNRIAANPAKPAAIRGAALEWLQSFHTYTSKQLDQADLAYRMQIELDPRAPWPKGNYACFLRVHRLDLARSEMFARQALEIMRYGVAQRCLASTLYLEWAEALVAQDTKRADALFAEASQLEPDLGTLVREVGNYPRAHPILEALAQKGISLDTMPGIAGGTTPLSIAAGNPNVEIATRMIRLGANPNTQGYAGVTPLMIAAQRGSDAMVRALLTSGADPTLRSRDGKDAEQFAIDANQLPTAGLIAAAKKTYVRPAGPLTAGVPFRVGTAYRVKKEYAPEKVIVTFRVGDRVVFDAPTSYGNPRFARFNFRDSENHIREFRVDKDQIDTWSEYFEEIGAAGAQSPR